LQVLTSFRSPRIRNAYVRAEAKGIYVVMDVTARNDTRAVVRLDVNRMELGLDGAEYRVDPTALDALDLGGRRVLRLATIPSGAAVTGWIVFDVPKAAPTGSARLCATGATGATCG
jgi:hypothetical protein